MSLSEECASIRLTVHFYTLNAEDRNIGRMHLISDDAGCYVNYFFLSSKIKLKVILLRCGKYQRKKSFPQKLQVLIVRSHSNRHFLRLFRGPWTPSQVQESSREGSQPLPGIKCQEKGTAKRNFLFLLPWYFIRACVTTQPSPLHAVREQKGFPNAVEPTGPGGGQREDPPRWAAGGTRQGGRLGDAKAGNSGSAGATLPHLPTPGGCPGPRGGGTGLRAPRTCRPERGGPAERPPRRRSLGRRREPGPGWSRAGRARGVGLSASAGSLPSTPSRLPPQIPSFSWDLFRFST